MYSHVAGPLQSLDFTQDKAAAGVRLPVSQEVQAFHAVETECFLEEQEGCQAQGRSHEKGNTNGLLSPGKTSDQLPETCLLTERPPFQPTTDSKAAQTWGEPSSLPGWLTPRKSPNLSEPQRLLGRQISSHPFLPEWWRRHGI